MTARIPKNVKEEAERIVYLTVEEAKLLPNLLGKTVAAHLEHGRGWRAATVDGVKTLYIRKETK